MTTSDVWKEFSDNEITHSAAHHLLAIIELIEKRGYARVSDVAKHLEITTGSASTNLRALKERQLVEEDDNKFLHLSTEGKKLAEGIRDRRIVIYDFLTDVLGVNKEQAEIDACKTEHLFSKETTSRMLEYAKKNKKV
jgi:DtxR family Mn-dependent transcriptional regulator